MSFLHCRFRYGEFEILSVTSDSAQEPLDDFVTSDIAYTNAFQFEEFSGFSEGTEVDTGGAAADATVILVPDTTSFVIGQTIGIELDVGTFHKSRIVSFVVDTSVTIANGISSAAGATNKVVTVNQLQGSTTGSNSQNFKSDKASQIKNRSLELEAGGFEYNGRAFFLNVNDNGDLDSRFTNDYLRLAAYAGIPAIDLGDTATLDIDERPYQFADATDFFNFFEAYYGSPDGVTQGRILEIYGGGTGQSGLITDITEAGNDQTSMNGITDTRT